MVGELPAESEAATGGIAPLFVRIDCVDCMSDCASAELENSRFAG